MDEKILIEELMTAMDKVMELYGAMLIDVESVSRKRVGNALKKAKQKLVAAKEIISDESYKGFKDILLKVTAYNIQSRLGDLDKILDIKVYSNL